MLSISTDFSDISLIKNFLISFCKCEKRWKLFQKMKRSMPFADLTLLNERSFLSLPKFHEQWARFAMLEARIRMFLDHEVPTCKRILYRLHPWPNRQKHLKFTKYFSIFLSNKNFSKQLKEINKIFHYILVAKITKFPTYRIFILSSSKFAYKDIRASI